QGRLVRGGRSVRRAGYPETRRLWFLLPPILPPGGARTKGDRPCANPRGRARVLVGPASRAGPGGRRPGRRAGPTSRSPHPRTRPNPRGEAWGRKRDGAPPRPQAPPGGRRAAPRGCKNGRQSGTEVFIASPPPGFLTVSVLGVGALGSSLRGFGPQPASTQTSPQEQANNNRRMTATSGDLR